MYDVVIKNGNIIDGTGQPSFLGDVAIKDDRIAKIGELHDEKSETTIDASGKIVCPGFIDVNNHSDTRWRIFSNPDLESLVYQGVTTIIGGNCGSSLAPLNSARDIETIRKWVDLKEKTVNWLSMQDFLDFLERGNLAVNFATLVGHATVRRSVLHDEVRSPNPKELNFFEKKISESIKEGALGISTGLVYSHARFSSFDELKKLAKKVKQLGGIYTTHIKDESKELLESLEEAIRLGKETGVKIHISHLKAVGQRNWSKMSEALIMIDKAKESGVDISFDVYPYTNTGSVLYTILPAWVAEGGRKTMLHRLKDLAIRDKVIEEMRQSDFEYDKVEIAESPLDKTLTRRKITEIAASQDKSVEDAIIDILIASEGRVITSMEVLSEENIKKAIKHPLSVVASNGSGYNIEYAKTGGLVHPRSFGSFMKVISKYVLGDDILTMEAAINKMTAAAAERFKIGERGKIKRGYFADVLVLNRSKISAPSFKKNPYQYSTGVEYSFLNGKMVIKEGKYEKVKNGKILRKIKSFSFFS